MEDPVTGAELTEKMRAQALRFGVEIKTDEEVLGLELTTSAKKVISRRSTYNAQAVIICTGTQRRKLRVPGEVGTGSPTDSSRPHGRTITILGLMHFDLLCQCMHQ